MIDLTRTEMLIGQAGISRLKKSRVAVFGIGGVGSYTCEALARSGIGALLLVDSDTIAPSNLNRQLIATCKTIGCTKVDVMRERILSINPNAAVSTFPIFYTAENADSIDLSTCDYIVDAIDTVSSKLVLIKRAKQLGVSIISSMGTGNKLDPSMFEITDLSKTSVCPLARVMRRELKKEGIAHLKVLYSKEPPKTPLFQNGTANGPAVRRQTPGSIAFVPSVAGLMIAGEVVRDLIQPL